MNNKAGKLFYVYEKKKKSQVRITGTLQRLALRKKAARARTSFCSSLRTTTRICVVHLLPHAVYTQVAEAENPRAVGHHAHVHVTVGPIVPVHVV